VIARDVGWEEQFLGTKLRKYKIFKLRVNGINPSGSEAGGC